MVKPFSTKNQQSGVRDQGELSRWRTLAVVFNLESDGPASILAQNSLRVKVYFSGFQYQYVKGTGHVPSCAVTPRPHMVLGQMMMIMMIIKRFPPSKLFYYLRLRDIQFD